MTSLMTVILIGAAIGCVVFAIVLNYKSRRMHFQTAMHLLRASELMDKVEARTGSRLTPEGEVLPVCPDCGAVAWGNTYCNTCVSHWDAPEETKARIMRANEERIRREN